MKIIFSFVNIPFRGLHLFGLCGDVGFRRGACIVAWLHRQRLSALARLVQQHVGIIGLGLNLYRRAQAIGADIYPINDFLDHDVGRRVNFHAPVIVEEADETVVARGVLCAHVSVPRLRGWTCQPRLRSVRR